jgi:hypothetical protein
MTAQDLDQRRELAASLVKEEWTDADGNTWYVRSYELAGNQADYQVRIVRRGSGVGRWATIEQVEEYLAAEGTPNADTNLPAADFDPTELIGKSWADEDGQPVPNFRDAVALIKDANQAMLEVFGGGGAA